MSDSESKRDFLRGLTHEQLEIFVLNNEYKEEKLRKKLFLLSGCREFGSCDPSNAACIECFHNNQCLFDRCCPFSDMINSYNKKQLTKSLNS